MRQLSFREVKSLVKFLYPGKDIASEFEGFLTPAVNCDSGMDQGSLQERDRRLTQQEECKKRQSSDHLQKCRQGQRKPIRLVKHPETGNSLKCYLLA